MSATADQELAELRRRYAELQRANAELRNERDGALAELQARDALRSSEYGERIAHQAATIDVLKAMSASPGDPQPVFVVIVRLARDLCDAYGASLAQVDDGSIVLRAYVIVDEAAAKEHEGNFPRPVAADTMFGRTILAREPVQLPDVAADQTYALRAGTLRGPVRAQAAVPLMRDGEAIGAINITRRQTGEFSPAQIELLQVFAEQAVIAITSAETYRALHEALEQQTATAEVLQVINASPGILTPVFDAILEKAHILCKAPMGALVTYDGKYFQAVATRGYSETHDSAMRRPFSPNWMHQRLVDGARLIHFPDIRAVASVEDGELARTGLDSTGMRTAMSIPLRKDGRLLGFISAFRTEVRPFSDREIALLENFAAQAVIAMENARLLTEQREALEQQTATAEVLQVINTSPGDLTLVFDAMLEKAMRLCGAAYGVLRSFDGERMHMLASRGVPPALAEFLARDTGIVAAGTALMRALQTGRPAQNLDAIESVGYKNGVPSGRAIVELGGARTILYVPLVKDQTSIGVLTFYRQEVRGFSAKQIALLENFAAQAVIAMENARLLNEVRQRQEELHITFENMGDGVAMFDETQHLVAWNSKFQEVFDLPETLLGQHRTYEDYLRFLATRGDFGTDVNTTDQIQELVATTGKSYGYERTRPDGRVIEIRRNPVPDGGFVLIFSDITERKRSEVEIRAARDAAEAAYRDLKAAQASLIQAEKMASLGQLTAGIAHEIKNPLNFVNNFASLSIDLLDELKQTAAPGLVVLDEARRSEFDELTITLARNLDKINEHGRRADGIVRGMLEHSRGSSGERRQVELNALVGSGERRQVELNALVDEALNLAYHGARAQDQSFNVTLQRELSEGIAPITLAPQDVTRVLLNLFSNGFYAARERQRTEGPPGFEPTLKVSTRELDGAVEIRVRDNGIGIPSEIRDRLFQPFFTTKPPGEGTGLGLSMSYDIITPQHGGSISVNSKVGEYSEFTVRLPRRS